MARPCWRRPPSPFAFRDIRRAMGASMLNPRMLDARLGIGRFGILGHFHSSCARTPPSPAEARKALLPVQTVPVRH
jgi:hypothetical protein